MTHKKTTKILLGASLLLFVLGLVFAFSEEVGLCQYNEISCINLYSEGLAQPLILGMLALVITLIALLFIRQEVFKAWSKFALVAIPLAVIWIALTPVQSGSGAIAGLGIAETRESVTWIASIAFFAISLLIILVKSLKIKNTR